LGDPKDTPEAQKAKEAIMKKQKADKKAAKKEGQKAEAAEPA
jgi:hypothetical protein